MNNDQLKAAIQKCSVESAQLSMQMEAHRKLHDGAALLGDGEEAQRQREAMHSTLDAQLDKAAQVMVLTRKLFEAME